MAVKIQSRKCTNGLDLIRSKEILKHKYLLTEKLFLIK